MTSKTDFFAGIILLLVCAIFAWQVYLIPDIEGSSSVTPSSFPSGVLFLLSLCSLRLVYTGLRGKIRPKNLWPEHEVFVKTMKFFLFVVVYIIAFVVIGTWSYSNDYPYGLAFCSTTFLFMLFAQLETRPEKKLMAFIVAIISSLFLFGTFFYFFKVMLP